MSSTFSWWMIPVAAVLVVLMLFDSVGRDAGIAMLAAVIGGAVAYRWYRSRHPVQAPGIRCLRCGEALAATARNCPYCGSANWTYR